MPKPSRSQRGFVLAIVAVAAFHMFSVTAAAIPTNTLSTRLSPATAYLNPYFTQNWRLFAPNPIADDRTLWFRGEYVDAAGQTQATDWFDWTAVELDLVRHKVVGGRAGYISNKLIGPLNQHFLALSLSQRELAAQDRDATKDGYVSFRDKLIAAGGNPVGVGFYLRYETSTVRLATSVLEALHPDTTFTAVRYRIVRRPVVAYDNRLLPAAERAKSRPSADIRRSGWRKPIESNAATNRTIADFVERHQ